MSTLTQTPPRAAGPAVPLLTCLALLVAVVGSAGSVYLSVGMGLKACPLCFYQRSFMLAVVGVLGVGLLAGMRRSVSLSLLALPLAVAGLFVAGFHVNLERAGVLECPKGVGEGLGTAPQQSLAVFVVLSLVLLLDLLGPRPLGAALPTTLVAGALGGLFAALCVWSSPPLPDAPKSPYKAAPDVCRRPYVEPE